MFSSGWASNRFWVPTLRRSARVACHESSRSVSTSARKRWMISELALVADTGTHAYRVALERRDRGERAFGRLLPSVAVQARLIRLVHTDLTAQLAYQDRIRAFHARLRSFYYGNVSHGRPFGKADSTRATLRRPYRRLSAGLFAARPTTIARLSHERKPGVPRCPPAPPQRRQAWHCASAWPHHPRPRCRRSMWHPIDRP